MGSVPPSIDELARQLELLGIDLPAPLLVDAAREAVALGDPSSAGDRARRFESELLGRVVNATGVLLHTNLGRAPLDPSFYERGSGYAALEIELETGRRGERSMSLRRLLRRLTGCEDALVVNNGAAALGLAVAAIANGTGVVVGRGELIEIGGGVRIPEILEAFGARLVEVGTTNICRLEDYQGAIDDGTGAILCVHQSNFQMTGYTKRPSVRELSTLGPPLIVDLGSGLLDASTPWLEGRPPTWLGSEPAVRQTLVQGASVVTFSGDKLLGGPQAGIIAGNREIVTRCASHGLARALRPGRMVLGALEQTLLAYLRKDLTRLPFWKMATATTGEIETRARRLARAPLLRAVECQSVIGGGSVPGASLASFGLAVDTDVRAELRAVRPPVIARMTEGITVCDLRTVDPADDGYLVDVLLAAVSAKQSAAPVPR